MSSAGVSFRAFIGRMGIAIVLCVVLVGAGVFAVNDYIDEQIDKIPRIELATASTTNNGTNFLIIGSDSRDFVASDGEAESFGTNTDAGPPKSDTMMVLHANDDRSYAVSFPRDLWVTIPGRGELKLNAAFNDGPQAVVDTLQQNFGVAVNHYLEVDFRSFEALVDAIGTIPVWFDYTTRDLNTGLLIPFAPACYQLNGAQSLAYVRARSGPTDDFLQYWIDGEWVSADAIPDIGRIERQQEFVKKLGRLAVERATDDPTIAPDLADKVIPNLEADAGFDRGAFNHLAQAMIGLSSGDGTSIEFATLPSDGARRDGQDVLLAKQPEADAMLARLRGEVVPEPATEEPAEDSAPVGLRPSDVRLSVRNGSDVSGAAADALQTLGNRGFVRGTATNDDRGVVQRTEVRHRPGDQAKAELVASYVEGGATLVSDNALSSDIVLVLGKDFQGIAEAPATSGNGSAPAVAPPSLEELCR